MAYVIIESYVLNRPGVDDSKTPKLQN